MRSIDDPDQARRQVALANKQWSRDGFHLQHYYELLANCQIDLYTGNGDDALEHVVERWSGLAGSLLLRVQNVRIESHHLRARCALAATRDRELHARRARKDARKIRREEVGWARALADLVDGRARRSE